MKPIFARFNPFLIAFLAGSLIITAIISGFVIADMRSAKEFREMIHQAQRYIDMGQPELVKGLIEPQLAKYPRPEAQSEAYRLLAAAEERQMRYRFAAAFYYQMYRTEPTEENLQTLAQAYETAGEWARALWAYNQLAQYPDLQQHIQWIEDTCQCTPAPPK